MVYIESWDDFYAAAHQMYLAAPSRTRYCVKYRDTGGRLTLKVTDNATCLKYRSNQKEHLKEVEKLTTLFFRLMTTVHPEAVSAVHEPLPSAQAAAPAESATGGDGKGKSRK
eukprot:TRINITY_DN23904_c0_g1_i1.p1 TRINITY_DN23904_c0_g1~~TRINITY_DN23904_c0_g1_i1.p1  ORF type:complete len:112 (-),score=26.54 TRINITY_DN23904_c0_g1_i1:228-563(-)